jgi:sugar lactone lactonase YvrE
VAVKFDSKGQIISPQALTGEVLRIDPQNGNQTVLATLDPGLDNVAFMGDRLFVSHMTDGRITEILAGGKTRSVLPGGFHAPLDLTLDENGYLYIADHVACYVLPPGGGVQPFGAGFVPGFPTGMRGIISLPGGRFAVTTWGGKVARWLPAEKAHDVLAEGLDQPYGIAVASRDAYVVAELGAGRVLLIGPNKLQVLATGLDHPMGVVVASDGTCLVSEHAAGRIVKITESGSETILDGLLRPQGMAMHDGMLYIVDAGAHALIAFDLKSRSRRTIASDLPVGAPPGVIPKPLRGSQFSGPFGPFAGVEAGPDGTLYISADSEGSVIALRPEHH